MNDKLTLLSNVCKPDELLDNLMLHIEFNNTVLIKGRLGSGKSALAVDAARLCGIAPDCIFVDDPHLKEVADYVGLPHLNTKTNDALFYPIGIMRQILAAERPTVVIFDEIDKAFKPTANAIAQIIHGRQINGQKIPDVVRFIATCNLPDEETGSQVIPTHLLDRYATVLELQQDEAVWAAYMHRKYGTNATTLTQFIRFRPHFLLDGQNTELALNIEKTPTARSLENFYKMLTQIQQAKNLTLEDALHHPTLQKSLIGACGQTFFIEFAAFCSLYKDIPSIKQIVANPQKAPIPTEQGKIGQRHAIISMLARHINDTNANAIYEYLMRPEWNPYASLRQVFIQNIKNTENPNFNVKNFSAQILQLAIQ